MPSASGRASTHGPETGIPAAAPTRLAARLADVGDRRVGVLHVGRDAAYLAVATDPTRCHSNGCHSNGCHSTRCHSTWCLGVVTPSAVQVPLALRVRDPALDSWDWGSARLVDGTLRVGCRTLRIGRLLDVRVPRRPAPARAATRAHAVDGAEDDAFAKALVDARIGRGDGLTPAGDDWLCGWVSAHRSRGLATPAVDARIRASLHRTTTLSAGLLDCALAGEAIPEVADWIEATDTSAATAAEAALVRVGHSSGTALLAGLRAGSDRAEEAA